ncbi:4738_t:CDS:2 [Acaulospora morrowiae]|uniref:4738_t:CDS:1 n=1 Tax=Acaulospora morrowiae TaxID=94023 RepID=A0A9N9A4X4_9GLOM|nr:4738_t:CDS:2 [Acaulospora morrowiae]
MNNDFSSTYLQSSNGGNNSYSNVDAQPNNTGYDASQNIPYSWGMPEQPPPSAPAVPTSASINAAPSKGSYSDNNGKGIPNNKSSAIINGSGSGNNNINNRSPEYVEYTQQCVQTILEINSELIRVCIDYQNNNLLNEQELIQYKQRLQVNLSYLATVADEYNNNSRNEIKPKAIPDLSLLPTPRGSHGKNLNSLVQRAVHAFANHKKFHRHTNINSNNKGFTNTTSTQATPDTDSSASPRQYKLSSSSNGMMNSSSQYQQAYQKQQQSSAALQQQIPPQPPQQPQIQQPPQHPQQMQQHSQQQLQHSQQMHQQQQLQQASQQQHSHQQSQQIHPHQQSQQSSSRYSNSMLPSVTMAAAYQQHSSSLQQNMIANNMPDYSMVTTSNQEHSYQVLPPLVGVGIPVNGSVNAGNTNNVNGSGNGQTAGGILPSIIGLSDQYSMSTSQQQQLQLQNVGFSGFVGSGGAGTGFGPANAFGMMRYPSSGGMVNNSGIVNNNTIGNNGIGINASYGNNSISGNTLGLPNMLNHENGM